MTLRVNGRPRVSFMSNANKTVQFWFTEGPKRFITTIAEDILPGERHSFGVSWNGEDVRIYRNGRIVATGVQLCPLPAKALSYLRMGPFPVDGYMACEPWADDVIIERVRAWNAPVDPKAIADEAGLLFKGVAAEMPARLQVTRIPDGVPPPVIDGKADEKAWDYAASMPQLVRLNFAGKSGAMPPHGFRLTYDDANLYLLTATHFPGRVPYLEGLCRTEDFEPQACGAEAWEFYLWIGGHKYRLTSTAAGGTSDRCDNDYGWSPAWQYEQTRATQIDDSVIWTGEAAFLGKCSGSTVRRKTKSASTFAATGRLRHSARSRRSTSRARNTVSTRRCRA